MDAKSGKIVEDSIMQEDDNLGTKKRKIVENSIERRLRGPTIKTYPSGPSKDVHLSHPLVLEMPKLSNAFPLQKHSDKKTISTSNKEAWKRRQGKFALATCESQPHYMWLPFFGKFLAFVFIIIICKIYNKLFLMKQCKIHSTISMEIIIL